MTPRIKVQYCPECKWDSGIHYAEDGSWSRPHLDVALAKASALSIVETAHEQQTKQARLIIQEAAERMLEFSANQIREAIEQAGIDGPVVGAAFTHAEREGWIEATGRSVQSTDPATRHRINVWASRIHPRVKQDVA